MSFLEMSKQMNKICLDDMEHDIKVALQVVADKYGCSDFAMGELVPVVLSADEVVYGTKINFLWEELK